jgi:hypothetical protein
MVSKKHLELVKKQIQDRYERSASPSSMQEVGSSSRRRTAPTPSRQEASPDDSFVKMWEVAPPPPTRLKEALSNDSPSTSLGYNDECPHIKEVS